MALSGYCPVSLVSDRALVVGKTEYTVRHAGRIYRFASVDSSDRFREDPDRYVPVKNGSCPVNQMDRGKALDGNPKWGVLYKNHLFLCASEQDRRRFLQNPDHYATVDVAERGFCAHCIRESGLLVRGDESHEVARHGWRYWFPDEQSSRSVSHIGPLNVDLAGNQSGLSLDYLAPRMLSLRPSVSKALTRLGNFVENSRLAPHDATQGWADLYSAGLRSLPRPEGRDHRLERKNLGM